MLFWQSKYSLRTIFSSTVHLTLSWNLQETIVTMKYILLSEKKITTSIYDVRVFHNLLVQAEYIQTQQQ